jgi:nucleoside-triphosphatase
VIDEIGKMELFSPRFREAVLEAIRSPKPVLATITKRPNPFADRLKAMQGVVLIEVTPMSRDALPQRIREMLGQ